MRDLLPSVGVRVVNLTAHPVARLCWELLYEATVAGRPSDRRAVLRLPVIEQHHPSVVQSVGGAFVPGTRGRSRGAPVPLIEWHLRGRGVRRSIVHRHRRGVVAAVQLRVCINHHLNELLPVDITVHRGVA